MDPEQCVAIKNQLTSMNEFAVMSTDPNVTKQQLTTRGMELLADYFDLEEDMCFAYQQMIEYEKEVKLLRKQIGNYSMTLRPLPILPPITPSIVPSLDFNKNIHRKTKMHPFKDTPRPNLTSYDPLLAPRQLPTDCLDALSDNFKMTRENLRPRSQSNDM